MNNWNACPGILKRKTVLTLLTGTGCISITILIFLIYRDRMLLILGICFLLGCMLRSVSLYRTVIHRKYDTVTGVCIGTCSSPLRRYRKIYLIDADGNETALLLGKSTPIKKGALYRFYFQTDLRTLSGNDYLDAALSAHAFLGYEELPQNLLCPPIE